MAAGNGNPDPGDAQRRLLAAIEPALALPTVIPLTEIVLPPGISIAQHDVASRNVVWLRFCGLNADLIAEKTGLELRQVSRFLKSAEFHRLYERHRSAMLAQVDDVMRERLQEVVGEAIETKVWLMRNARNGFLRNRVASELIQLGREIMQLGKGNVTDLLKAVHEQAVKESKDGSRTTTQRVTLEGDSAVVAQALRRTGDGATGDSPAPAPDDSPGSGGSGERAPEAPVAPGGAGSDETG